jgi:transposase InsO family protein
MPNVSVRTLCYLLNINRPWHYQHRHSCVKDERDRSLCLALHLLRNDFAAYGYRRMTKALQRQGWKINHKRVERVMQQTGLICRRKPRYVHTTDSHHSEPIYANLIRVLARRSTSSVLGSGSDLCTSPRRLCVPGLSARCVLTHMHWLVLVSQDG